MERKLQDFIYNVVKIAEIFIAALLAVAIIISSIKMGYEVVKLLGNQLDIEAFESIISYAFSLVIGVEFIKMICKYTPNIIIEVVLFTVARYLVINHSSATSTLLGVIAIAGVFATRKYLFSNFDELEKNSIINK